MKKKTDVKKMVLTALLTALLAVLAQIQIPMRPVPFNLAVMGVFLAGLLLPPRWAVSSVVLYILLGAVGIPVFAGFVGGPAVLVGPTGGYIAGYLFLALVTSLGRGGLRTAVPAMLLGLVCLYAFGTAWFVVLSGRTLAAALQLCVLPFLLPDICKGAAAYALCRALRTRLQRLH